MPFLVLGGAACPSRQSMPPPAARNGGIPCRVADCLFLMIDLTAVPAKPPDGMGTRLPGVSRSFGLGANDHQAVSDLARLRDHSLYRPWHHCETRKQHRLGVLRKDAQCRRAMMMLLLGVFRGARRVLRCVRSNVLRSSCRTAALNRPRQLFLAVLGDRTTTALVTYTWARLRSGNSRTSLPSSHKKARPGP